MTDEAIIEALTTYPILIERPILVKDKSNNWQRLR
jgi:arsenate reductase-like glutaredoxin family protein